VPFGFIPRVFIKIDAPLRAYCSAGLARFPLTV
jgi:hypothetical protein